MFAFIVILASVFLTWWIWQRIRSEIYFIVHGYPISDSALNEITSPIPSMINAKATIAHSIDLIALFI